MNLNTYCIWDLKSLIQPQHALQVKKKKKKEAEHWDLLFCEEMIYAQLESHKSIKEVVLD